MHEPSLRGTDGELVTPWGSDARLSPLMSEAADRLRRLAGRMAESDIMSGLPTGTEAAR
jgi:hypothetical protein